MLAFYLSEIETKDEKEKFEKIYLRYEKEMFVIANKILRNRENAEDAVQDAFVLIMRNLDKIHDIYEKKTANYIRVIVKNRALQIYNQQKKGEVLVDDYNFFTEHPDNSQSMEERFAKKELADVLAGMILELPDRYKEVLYLYYYNEMSYAKIAGILDITEANARQIARRARMILEEKVINERLLEKQTPEGKAGWERAAV